MTRCEECWRLEAREWPPQVVSHYEGDPRFDPPQALHQQLESSSSGSESGSLLRRTAVVKGSRRRLVCQAGISARPAQG